jgi:hypothetical protein
MEIENLTHSPSLSLSLSLFRSMTLRNILGEACAVSREPPVPIEISEALHDWNVRL